jgi:hypothetical protein
MQSKKMHMTAALCFCEAAVSDVDSEDCNICVARSTLTSLFGCGRSVEEEDPNDMEVIKKRVRKAQLEMVKLVSAQKEIVQDLRVGASLLPSFCFCDMACCLFLFPSLTLAWARLCGV